ncbi:MAG: tetratricopeptide repeat protein [Prevotellaceae bacterium]|nr:tetratricopeptide repeat protein [Prevotellaceae bacterium]
MILTSYSIFSSCTGKNGENEKIEYNDSISAACNGKFIEARKLQNSQEYDKAIDKYKECLLYYSEDENICEKLLTIETRAMLQIMNSYQSEGKPEECIECLRGIADSSRFIRKYCMRDLYSILGYALSRTENMAEAEDMTAKALDMPLYKPNHERLFRDYAYAAAVFYSNPDRQEEVVELCKKALEEASLDENKSGAQWVTSLLGSIYKRTGRLSESIDLLEQSIETAKEQNDTLGEINAYNAMSDIYLYWNMPDYAFIYATMAIQKYEETKKDNPMVATTSYIRKGQAMEKLGLRDSAFYYFRSAEKICKNLPYNSGYVDIDLFAGAYMIENCHGDSLRQGVKRLQKVAKEATSTNRAKAYHQLALYYLKIKDNAKAEIMLDSMYKQIGKNEHPIYIGIDYEPILNYFINKKDIENVERYVKLFVGERKFNLEEDINMKMSKAIVKLQTEKKDKELLVTQMKLDNSNLAIRFYIVAIISVVIIFIIIYFYSKRIYRMRRQIAEEHLSALMANLEKSQLKNTNMEQQITELLSDKEKRKDIEAVTPSILRDKGEYKFRQRFEQLYPTFLPALRKSIPSISKREKLLCMLIILGQDNQQIANLLNIAQRSVHMLRHRLRQKMTLEDGESLENYIQKLTN